MLQVWHTKVPRGGTIQGSVVEAQSSERRQWATVEGAPWQ